MEMNNERVLAYQLATPITSDELDEVSGGGAQSIRWTYGPSGNSASGLDATIDAWH